MRTVERRISFYGLTVRGHSQFPEEALDVRIPEIKQFNPNCGSKVLAEAVASLAGVFETVVVGVEESRDATLDKSRAASASSLSVIPVAGNTPRHHGTALCCSAVSKTPEKISLYKTEGYHLTQQKLMSKCQLCRIAKFWHLSKLLADASCVAELHLIIVKEREINQKLQEENLCFRKKLGLDEGGIQTTVTQIRTKEKEQKKSRKRNKKTKEVPDGKGQPCNSNENAAASEPNDDSKVQPDNSLQNGEQEEDIVEDNEDGNVNDTTESKTVPKEKNTKHDT
eukprot:gene644-10348_t